MLGQLQAGKTLCVLLLILTSLLSTSEAVACETVEYDPSPFELRKDAIGFFRQETAVYEGVLLGSHDFKAGGKFLVLKSYKGPASAFSVIQLPGGSSCYGGVPSFAMGMVTNYGDAWSSFDGLVSDQYVDVWRERGLVEGGLTSPITFLKLSIGLLLLLIMALAVLWLGQRRKDKAV
jgi:hypothetical protein